MAILSIGTRLSESLRAAFIMKDAGDIGVTVADARFMKPLDTDLMSVQPKPLTSPSTRTLSLPPSLSTPP